MKTEFLTIEICAEHVAQVTIDNPPVNAHNNTVLLELAKVFDAMSDRDDVRVVILTGAGRIFCAGIDIKSLHGQSEEAGTHWQNSRLAREAYHSIRECNKPVIGALNGPALGGGLAIAASCDILIASQNAMLGLPEIDVGLLGGGRHAQRLFSHSTLRRMMLTGYRVPAEELYRLGVVEACVEPDKLQEASLALAKQIASKSPTAIQLAKHGLNVIEELSLRDGYRFEQSLTAQISETDDSKEAMAAFLEKREPEFKGC